jgi:hypothetical protein
MSVTGQAIVRKPMSEDRALPWEQQHPRTLIACYCGVIGVALRLIQARHWTGGELPMHRLRRALLCGIVLLAAACHSTTAPNSLPATVSPPNANYAHAGSGFKFPETVRSFGRIGIDKYDSSGDNISVGYNSQPYLIAATVYVYPAGEITPSGSPPSEAHFKAVKAEIERVHPQAILLVDDAKVTLANAIGVKATYRLEDEFAGAKRSLISEAYLFGLGTWFVKYRFTYPEISKADASARITDFMNSLTWP